MQVSLEPLSTEEMSRIWTLFPTANYRTSVAYIASPVWIDPPKPRSRLRARGRGPVLRASDKVGEADA